jgi:hypothetical protein
MRNQGLDIKDFATLFRSANDYVEVWAKCEERSAALKEANPEYSNVGAKQSQSV